jgi:hypothetical protein
MSIIIVSRDVYSYKRLNNVDEDVIIIDISSMAFCSFYFQVYKA